MDFISDGNFAIHLTDLSRARNFYRDKLGFKLLQDSDEKLVFETGKFTLREQGCQKSALHPSSRSERFEQAKSYVKSLGCEIVREWPKSKALYFRDPLGQLIDIIERK